LRALALFVLALHLGAAQLADAAYLTIATHQSMTKGATMDTSKQAIQLFVAYFAKVSHDLHLLCVGLIALGLVDFAAMLSPVSIFVNLLG
jgi:hypothetical protein